MNRRQKVLVATAVALGLALRLAHFALVRRAPFVAALAMDAQEYERWARAIAAGDWLGSAPFFQAPLYPYLVAAVFRIFARSLDAVYLLQIATSGVAALALSRATSRILGERAGLAVTFLFALFLPFVFHDVQLGKESFAVSIVCFVLLALVRARDGARGGWFVAGLLLGLLALLRENTLFVMVFLLPLAWMAGDAGPETRAAEPEDRAGRRRRAALGVRRAVAMLGGVVLVLLPVALRNGALGGGFLPTTSQGGINFWIGNNADADGTYRPLSPGKQIPALEREEPRRIAEERLGRRLSAAEVSGYWFRQALDWAWREPGRFVALEIRKLRLYWSFYEWPDAVDYYWMKSISPPLSLPLVEFGAIALLAPIGLLLARPRWNALAPVLLFEVGWMLSTIAFFLFSRYRLPAVPGLLMLAAIPVERAATAIADRNWRSAFAFGGVVAVAIALPHLAGFAPRTELVEFNLGRLAEESGSSIDAAEHYRNALAADPKAFLAAVNLGRITARAGDLASARDLFAHAVTIEPRCEPARANLGAALFAMGDLDGAERELDAALALDSESREALHNRVLVAVAKNDAKAARRFLDRLRAATGGDASTRALATRVERLERAAAPAP